MTLGAQSGREPISTLSSARSVVVRVEHRARYVELEGSNVVGELPGSGPEQAVVGAHYDTQIEGSGVWDNGTGVASLVAIAEALRGAVWGAKIPFRLQIGTLPARTRVLATHWDSGRRAAPADKPWDWVVVLSQLSDLEYALALLRRGSERRAYLLKERVHDLEQLAEAIREVAGGGSVIDPKYIHSVVNRGDGSEARSQIMRSCGALAATNVLYDEAC